MRHNAVYLVNHDPLILTGGYETWQAIQTTKPCVFLYHNPWKITWKSIPRYLRIASTFKKPNQIHFITNEKDEATILKCIGLQATCLGHNLHVRDQLFQPNQSITKQFDAVYTATIEPYKRLELAQNIKSLQIITYKTGQKQWDLHEAYPQLNHANFNQSFITREEVVKLLQSSYCGLALSACEGAMFACTEYLLAGIPVVTTINQGGRNRYLMPEWTKTVAPNPNEIKQAVTEFKKNPINPDNIHNKTMELITNDRTEFLKIAEKYGAQQKNLWSDYLGIEKHEIPLNSVKINAVFG